ncbi:MAG: aminodeoxychorismate lyase [Legionellales bacterium]|nr:aminodeoxychorismate lyase [Legionellales bacterium]|tara:strand:+ start:1680 stop:2681 length:1002 start_codon:yes stop_codon:yes gene_type:complete
MKKKLVLIAVSLLSILLVICLWRFITFSDQPLIPTTVDIYYELLPGTSLTQVAKNFSNLGLLKHPIEFVVFARLEGKSQRLQAGEYLFPRGATNDQVLNMLTKGTVLHRKITFIDGWTLEEMMQAISKNPYLKHTLNKQNQQAFFNHLNDKHASLEGMFYPDTYAFAKGISDKVILQKAYQKMQIILAREWANRDNNLPYKTAYQALIVASLIEKETALENEKPLISGVIAQRLMIGMPLQIDPTVIYGMGDKYQGNISKQDLQTDSPYNTYMRKGLPPTPIALPDEASIYAALHPILNGYLYFVAKGDGSHVFSKTLKEQNAAVRKYILDKQ